MFLNKIKQWVLNRKFVIDSIEDFKKQWIRDASIDAFKKACEDLEETNTYNTEERAKELANKMFNDLLSPVDLTKIITVDKTKGMIYIGGDKADAIQLSNLKAETDFLLKSEIWKLLCETPKELAQRQMFISSESLDDMKKGKSILYTLSAQKNILDVLQSYQQIK